MKEVKCPPEDFRGTFSIRRYLCGGTDHMKLTLRYSITHFTHWAAGTAAVSFATLYLMNRGVSAGMAGTLLALSGLLSCISQPFLAAAADRAKKMVIVNMLIGMSVICCLCFVFQLLPGLPVLAAGIFYMIGIWSSDAMVPILNALSVAYQEAGYEINYGMGRGVGAIASAVSALGVGVIIAKFGTVWMILFLLFFRAAGIFALIGYPKIQKNISKKSGKTEKKAEDSCTLLQFVKRYKWYCTSLLAILFLGMFHAMTENYMIVIMEKLGGDSSNVGVAIFIASMVAFPVICSFSFLYKRLRVTAILKIAAVSFLAKSILFYFAGNVTAIYFIQLIQITSYAFLAPAQVYYANEKVNSSDMVKGQAFITAAYALGCSAGNFAGGQLLPMGANAIMQAGIVMAAVGTGIMFLTVNQSDGILEKGI